VNDSVNFITALDGFTLRDLVSYNHKHNDANMENNRDGTDDNRSWNCGAEGETDDEGIIALRQRQVRNFLMTLIFSYGTPMITAGDEFGRSQQGNNNAYCQDSPISWASWAQEDCWYDITEFLSLLIRIRRDHPALSPSEFVHREDVCDAAGASLGRPHLAWLNGGSGEMGEADWHDMGRRLLGMYSSTCREAFILWLHSGNGPAEITLPDDSWGSSYSIIIHSAGESELPRAGEILAPGSAMPLPAHCAVLMKAEVSLTAGNSATTSSDEH
jgi:glycogen operon protein